jgi:short-subunit dehydrogenase
MPHHPDHRAVVITGASSGVGRAAAHAFARRGANIVLCARGPEALQETAAECRRMGAAAVVIPTDVRDPQAVQRLARMAAETFGGIGVWINNAGTGAVGAYWEVPLEAHRATIETNLLGCIHGSHAALPYFVERGRGVLVNNVSIGGFVPTPYAAAYAASKFGIRAFSDSLRQELARWPDVHVCAVYPYFLDTPGVQHAANYTGRRLKPAPFVYQPEVVAETMVRLVERPRPQTLVGAMAKLGKLQHQLAPGLVEWALARGMEAYFSFAGQAPVTDGAIFEPMRRPMQLHGGWRHPLRRAGAAAALGLAAAGLVGARLRRRRAEDERQRASSRSISRRFAAS